MWKILKRPLLLLSKFLTCSKNRRNLLLMVHIWIPKTIVSDNGPPFPSFKMKTFLSKLNNQHKRITPLWPQANSQAESFMKPLIKTIRAAHIERRDCKKQLYNFLFSYRTTPHCTTRIPPSLMLNRVTSFTIPSFQTKVNANINHQA